jgi:hypothetical protein
MSGLLVETPISVGELIDKITILEIKLEKIAEEAKLVHVRREHGLLTARRDEAVAESDALTTLTREIETVNRALWDVEDELRDMERAGDFGAIFVEKARAVYKTNDERARIKTRINDLTGSALSEQKSYV